MSAPYSFRNTERKWQTFWQETNPYRVSNTPKNPYYVLEQFPYPSGRLHMGHVRVYTLGDTIARYKRAQGKDVLHPMGWDSFGLPAENAAISHGVSPDKWTNENIKAMKTHFQSLGFSYDWDREITTSHVSYYGQEQKLFLSFLESGLAYQKESWVNWDPKENTVLANEQVIDGKGWRSGVQVERRRLRQWFLKTSAFSKELLGNLAHLPGWPDSVKVMQENWIGQSTGVFLSFLLKTPPSAVKQTHLEVFTTRPETLFGASFIALSPDHPVAECLALGDSDIQKFIEKCRQQDTSEANLQKTEKRGIVTPLMVQHPLDPSISLPVYLANFVLMDYGTGAIFGCPAHDERDYEFAQLFDLPIRSILKSEDSTSPIEGSFSQPLHDEATLTHSSFLNGLTILEARKLVTTKLKHLGNGREETIYRLRDWGVSRQRYWGCPIPVIYCPECDVVPVPLDQLPVVLPESISFTESGNPLDAHPTWKHVACPSCGGPAERETDTFDTFFESSWYFLRFCAPQCSDPLDLQAIKTFLPVNHYVGGIEHAVLHLLYSRFFTMALKKCGYLDFEEPFQSLLTQGMVCHETYQNEAGDWLYPDEVRRLKNGSYISIKGELPVKVGRSEKMSKSRKNVVDPSHILEEYGADTTRLFMLSDTPPEKNLLWSETGVEGCWKFVNRYWRCVTQAIDHLDKLQSAKSTLSPSLLPGDEEFKRQLHKTISFVTQAYDAHRFNTAIAQCRVLTTSLETWSGTTADPVLLKSGITTLLQLLFPMIPHITSELWERLSKGKEPLDFVLWPTYDPCYLDEAQVTLSVQVDGKLRGTLAIDGGHSEAQAREAALELSPVQKALQNLTIQRTIFIKNKVINFVTSS